MKKNCVKLGVVGLGRGMLVRSVLGQETVRITAICDRVPEKVQAAEEVLRPYVPELQVCGSFDELLEADIDAVLVATEAVDHVSYVIKALEAGKHVLSEIPAVNSLEEAKQLKTAVLAHPELKYMVAENCCYWAFIQAWKIMYEEGKFGQTVYAEAEYVGAEDYRDIKPENYPPEHWRSYNPSIKYLTHDLGPLLWIMDDYCVSVSCMEADVVYNPYVTPGKNGAALFKTAKGAVIRILTCFDAYIADAHNYSLIGTRGNATTDKLRHAGAMYTYASFADIPGSMKRRIEIPVSTAFAGEPTDGHGGADRKMLLDFARCILEDTPSPLDVDFAIRISLPGIIAHKSAVLGGTALEIPQI